MFSNIFDDKLCRYFDKTCQLVHIFLKNVFNFPEVFGTQFDGASEYLMENSSQGAPEEVSLQASGEKTTRKKQRRVLLPHPAVAVLAAERVPDRETNT